MKLITRIPNLHTLAIMLLAFGAAGCLQIETHVKLHEDGSAVIAERVRFSRRLLESQKADDPDRNVAALLEKATILKRMKQMGKGMQLVSHTVRDTAKGARECVSVFKIPQITGFKYVSPFFGKIGYGKQKMLTCQVAPLYSNSWTGTRAGYMEATFASPGPRHHRLPECKRPSPSKVQKYRDLGPVFADMMEGFKLRLVFESYAPVIVRGRGQRNPRSRPHKTYLIDIAGENIGRGGARFFDIEEVMADLLQMHINGPHVRRHSGYGATSQLFRFGDGGTRIMFRPSRHYFDKHFAGKTLTFDHGKKRQASFKNDGYHPGPKKDKDNKK